MRKVAFLHIPRTGGRALLGMLDGFFPAEAIAPAHEMHEFEALIRTGTLARYDFVRGHFGINLLQLLDRETYSITFLREPVDRVISTWRHLRDAPIPFMEASGNRGVAQIQSVSRLAKELQFDEFCEAIHSQGRLSFFNQQCVLLGRGRGIEFRDGDIPKVDQQLVDVAVGNLDRMSFVGIAEDFDSSARALLKDLALTFRGECPHANASVEAYPKIADKLKEKLVQWTAPDQLLYQIAHERRRVRFQRDASTCNR